MKTITGTAPWFWGNNQTREQDGYRVIGWFDANQPQYASAHAQTGKAALFALHFEDGAVVGGVKVNTDQRYSAEVGPADKGAVTVYNAAKEMAEAHDQLPFVFYGGPMLSHWDLPPENRKGGVPAYNKSFDAFASTGVLDLFDGFILDCHPNRGVSLAKWKRQVTEKYATLTRHKVKQVLAISADHFEDGGWIPEAEVVARFKFLVKMFGAGRVIHFRSRRDASPADAAIGKVLGAVPPKKGGAHGKL